MVARPVGHQSPCRAQLSRRHSVAPIFNIMNASELKELVPQLQSKKFLGLKDTKILSLTRLYLAIYNLIDLNGLDDEYGDLALYREKLEHLTKIISNRCDLRTSIERRATLYATLNYLQNNTTLSTCQKELEKHWYTTEQLIEEYIPHFHEDHYDFMELHAILRLIVIQWYGLVEEDGEQPPMAITFLRSQLAKWDATLQEDDSWPNLTPSEAYGRIMLLEMNSSMMLDPQYNDTLQRTYRHYCLDEVKRLSATAPKALTKEAINDNIRLFDAVRQVITPEIQMQEAMDIIAHLLETQMAHYSTDSTTWQQCQSVVIENLCWHISEDLQSEIFE